MKFTIKSKGIVNGTILDKYGKLSENSLNGIPQLSIPLSWEGFPEQTKSFAIVFMDNDNYEEQGVSWLHWSVANIPVEINTLEENCSIDIKKVDSRIIQGRNSWVHELPKGNEECNRYGGPAPMLFAHEYEFQLYALDSFLDLKDGYYHNQLLRKMKTKVLDKAVIYGKYNNI